MIRASLLAALLLFARPQEDKPDPAGEALFRKLADKIASAKTVRAQYELTMPGPAGQKVNGEIFLKGSRYSVTIAYAGGKATARSDGRRSIYHGGDAREFDASQITSTSVVEALTTWTFAATLARRMVFSARGFKSEGREKIGDVDCEVLAFTLKQSRRGGGDMIAAKAWINADTLAVVRREFAGFAEAYSRFEYDTDIPDETFLLHSRESVAAGQRLQVQRSIELFTRYAGAPPARLDDLRKRPADLAADIFWPEGGFWIGGALPPVKYAVDGMTPVLDGKALAPGDYRPVVAPTERVAKYYTTRVRLQLVLAAIDAYAAAFSLNPDFATDLWTRPADAIAWPEGGFVGAGKLPVDAWGKPFALEIWSRSIQLEVDGADERLIRLKDLTPDERKAMEAGAVARIHPPIAEVEAALAKLSADDLADRDKAMGRLVAWGPRIRETIERRLRDEKDVEMCTRLNDLLNKLQWGKPAWLTELKSLRVTSGMFVARKGALKGNDRNALSTLKTFPTAQADFRANDRDNDMKNNFWVRDVAGLHALEGTAKGPAPALLMANAIKLIETAAAAADRSEKRGDYPVLNGAWAAKAGYHFAVLKRRETAPGKLEAYDDGSGYNNEHFGFIAFPADPGKTGKYWFIVSEECQIWQKEADEDEVPTVFPLDPAADGWEQAH